MRGRVAIPANRRAAGSAAAALALAGAAAWGVGGRDQAENAAAGNQSPKPTAVVTRRDLVARDTFQGSLGYADRRSISSSRSGTVTWLPREGRTIRRGGVLYRVNDEPVVLLYGSYPLWRTLAAGVEGRDVRQLEQNLVALGYDPDRQIDVDGDFDSETEAAVERWQEDVDLTEDGSVDPDEAVFLPGPRRVSEVESAVGSAIAAGAAVMQTSSTKRVVTVDLDVRFQTLVRPGQSVEIELPNGRVVQGRIATVGKVARAAGGEGGSATIEVTISVSNTRGARDLDQAPVDVGIAREIRRNVLTVPVTALLAVAGGGYAVEVVRGAKTELVRVQPGLYADGHVEITGRGIDEGTKVVVPQ